MGFNVPIIERKWGTSIDWTDYIMSSYVAPPVLPPDADFVRNYGKKTPAGNDYRLNCPKCGDQNGKLYVNLEKGIWRCWRGCGSGRLGALQVHGGVQYTIEVETGVRKEIVPRFFSLEVESMESSIVNGYLTEERHLQEHIRKTFEIRGAIMMGKFAVAVPVITPLRKTEHWYFRFIGVEDGGLKHFSDFPKRELLYGHPRSLTSRDLYIMEGCFDVVCSVPFNSVCAWGKIITEEQIELLRYFASERFLVCLDSDVDINRKMRSLLRVKMETRKKVGIVELPSGKDPGDLGRDILQCPIMEL
jgi:hypothetical protein